MKGIYKLSFKNGTGLNKPIEVIKLESHDFSSAAYCDRSYDRLSGDNFGEDWVCVVDFDRLFPLDDAVCDGAVGALKTLYNKMTLDKYINLI